MGYPTDPADIGRQLLATTPPDGGASTDGGYNPMLANPSAPPPASAADIGRAVLAGKTPPATPQEAPYRPVANYGAGINEAIASTFGAPVDIINNPGRLAMATNPLLRIWNQIHPNTALDQPIVTNPIGGSESIKQAMGLIGANPSDVPANYPTEKVARAAGVGTGNMVLPWAAGRAGILPEVLAPGPAPKGVTGLLGQGTEQAVVGAGSGAAGQEARQIAGDSKWAPWADLLASTLTGVGLGGALGAGKAAANTAINIGSKFFQPFTQAGREQIAGKTLADAASNPDAVRQTLEAYPQGAGAPGEVVPGSAPTTFQLTGDTGLGQLERQRQTQTPGPFLDRASEQNAARVNAIESIAPGMSDPNSVRTLFQQQLQAIDAAGDAAHTAARNDAQAQLAAAGGTQPTETYGATMRGQMEQAKADFKANVERPAWNAIDPNGTLTINGTNTANTARQIVRDMPDTAKPMSSEEAAIFDAAQGIGPKTTTTQPVTSATLKDPQGNPVVLQPGGTTTTTGETPFSDFTALRSRLNDAIRDERATNGETVAYRRMVMLRQSMDNTMADTVSQQAGTWDAAAAQRYRDAADATIQRKTTFNAGQPGAVLQTSPVAGYKVPDQNVAGRLLQSPQTVRDYLSAGGDVGTAAGAAVNDLRSTALNPDGTLNLGRYNTWLRNNGEVVDSIPGLRDQLNTAAQAQQTVDTVAGNAAQQRRNLENGAASSFLNNEDPANAVARAFSTGDANANFRGLAQATASDPDARAGLKRAVADYITRNFLNIKESGTSGVQELSGRFQKFMGANEMPLSQIFSGDELQSMRNVADDLMRSNRSVSSTGIPGRSTTAQDVSAAGFKQSFLSHFVSRLPEALAVGGAVGGGEHAGLTGALIGAGVGALPVAARTLQQNGIKRADQLVTEALLDPTKARALLMRAQPGNEPFFTQNWRAQSRSFPGRVGEVARGLVTPPLLQQGMGAVQQIPQQQQQ